MEIPSENVEMQLPLWLSLFLSAGNCDRDSLELRTISNSDTMSLKLSLKHDNSWPREVVGSIGAP